MNVSKTITIDLNRPRKNVVHLGQDDNVREVLVNLLADGVPYDITADAPSGSFVFTVKYIKSNGTPGEYATTSTGLDAVTKVDDTVNQYIVRLDEHATDVPGFAEAFLTIYETTGTPKVLHSFPITVDVVRTTTDGTDPSAPYYNGTPYLVKAKQATKTAAMTQPVGADADGKLWTTTGGGGLSDDAKQRLLACFAHVAWADEHGQDYYDALEEALYPGPAPVTLVSITADYEQDRPIYDTDELDAIKAGDDLTVTANYSDGTSVVLGDDDYELSGTLTAGTSTITATYEGKTATFDVIVTASSILPSEYQQVEYIQSSRTQYIDTGVTPGGFPSNFNGYSVEITASVLTQQASGTAVLIGAGVQPGCWMGVVGTGVGLGTASGAYFTDIDTSIMQTYTLEWANTTLSAVCRDSTISRSIGSSVDNRPFTVFGDQLMNYPGDFRVSRVKISKNGTLLRDLVSCYRKADDVIGMYDIVNDTFYTNSGTGTFTKGGNV